MKRDKLGRLALLAVGIAACSALALWGVRRHAANTKLAEARNAVTAIAQGVARCSTARGYVPTSDEEAFLCAAFSPGASPHVRYQWVKESDPAGFVRAEVDLDADGAVDERVELDVACGPSGCRAASEFRDRRR
jgi:hypothetical protein